MGGGGQGRVPGGRRPLAQERDLLAALAHAIPEQLPGDGYRHGEGNSPAHLKTSLVGSSVTVVVQGGELVLGTWQGIYLCEHRDRAEGRRIVATLRARP